MGRWDGDLRWGRGIRIGMREGWTLDTLRHQYYVDLLVILDVKLQSHNNCSL